MSAQEGGEAEGAREKEAVVWECWAARLGWRHC